MTEEHVGLTKVMAGKWKDTLPTIYYERPSTSHHVEYVGDVYLH